MKNNRILFGEPVELLLLEDKLPPEILLVRHYDAFQIYIVKNVHEQILEHLDQTPQIESGGILVGHPFRTQDGETTFLIITACIPQHSNRRSVVHFTVGHDEIEIVRKELKEKYPGLVVVGWYHSHPGHGVFLSGQDMTIVRGIFNASWHIALVIDTIKRDEGFFIGIEGKRLQNAWIGLKEIPDSIKATALFNQAKEALEIEDYQEANELYNQLREFVGRSTQLDNLWKDRIKESRHELLRLPGFVPDKPIPRDDSLKPARQTKKTAINSWLIASVTIASLFLLFFCAVAVTRIENLNHLSIIFISGGLNTLVAITACYVILSRKKQPEDPKKSYPVLTRDDPTLNEFNIRTNSFTYSDTERFVSLVLLFFVTISWFGYSYFVFHNVAGLNQLTPVTQPTILITDIPIIQTSQLQQTILPNTTLSPSSSPANIPPSATVLISSPTNLFPVTTPIP